jgi:hypothetical protein
MPPRAPRKPTTPPNVGHPTKYTLENVQAILTALAIGNTAEDSCRAVGVGYSTMREWVGRYPEFADAVEKAGAQARQRMVGIVVKVASEGNWQAAMTYLERRDPEHWGRRERLDVMMDVRRSIEALSNDPAEVEAAVAEAHRLINHR